MLYYVVCLGIGFIIDKIKNKIVSIIFHRCSKQLLLTYTAEWHMSQKATLMDLLDWIIL